MSKDYYQKMGDVAFAKMEKMNAELLSLTYGSLVTQIIKDIGDLDAVNAQLEQMGYNIGIRLVDEFLAKSGVSSCSDFKETANVVAKVALRMFLGISAEVSNWNTGGTACSITFVENPLANFVELPASLDNLSYCNMLCGAIRGALEQLNMKVSCELTEDMLAGSEHYELRLELLELIKDEFIDDEV